MPRREENSSEKQDLLNKAMEEFSHLYNKTGYLEKGKVVGTITQKGLDLISSLEKKPHKLSKIEQIRYDLWLEYCALVFDNLSMDIYSIIENFGKINEYFPEYKELEEELNNINAENNSRTDIEEAKQLFQKLFTLQKKVEKQKPILIQEGKSDYFKWRFLPFLGIFSTAYFLLVISFGVEFAKTLEIFNIIILIASVFFVWGLLSYLGHGFLKSLLRPRI